MQNSNVIEVMGATGQVGQKVVLGLLAKGRRVRALTRDAAKAQGLAAKGAEIAVGDPADAAYLATAFAGAAAAFVMLPPNYGAADYRAAQNEVGAAVHEALAASGVKRVVNLSSIGAHLAADTGVINGLRDQELRLNRLAGTSLLHLRPAYFMENLAFSLEPIRHMGVVGSPLRPDLRFPMIATQDIADAAVQALLTLDVRGIRTLELLGPRDVTMDEVTAAVKAAADRPALQYAQFPYEAAQGAMVQAGLSPDAAKQLVQLYRGMNEGWLRAEEPRSARTTTPTPVEAFAKGFAHLI